MIKNIGLILGVFVFVVLSTSIASAADVNSSYLVPCDGVDCSLCSLVKMVNVIILWLFGIIFLIFAVIMFIAGWGLITSGGNQVALNDAKTKFQNAIIGLLIVMAAWLLIDTIMKGLLGGVGEIDGKPWETVECQTQTEPLKFSDLNTGVSDGQVENSTTTSACKIPPLSELSGQALDMEKGNSVIFNSANLQTCANKFISQVGGGAKINSAYRPIEYQNHLWEIKNRWCDLGLKDNTEGTCMNLKSAISSEVSKHFGSGWSCGAVAKSNSQHTSNGAVDIGGISDHSSPAVKTKANANCLIWRNYPGDPWHYDLKGGCTCS